MTKKEETIVELPKVIKTLNTKCDNYEQILHALVDLEDIRDIPNTQNLMGDYKRYISCIFRVAMMIMGMFYVAAIISKYIIIHYGILEPDYSNDDLEKAFIWSGGITICILYICSENIIMFMGQAFRAIHPKWELDNKTFYGNFTIIMVIGVLFVWFDISINYTKVGPDIIPPKYMNFTMKYMNDKIYCILYVLTFIGVALMLLLGNSEANKNYIKKYGKIKFLYNRLIKIQKEDNCNGEDRKIDS